jgi:hypothetical protein
MESDHRGKQIMVASLCLRDIAFSGLFRKNVAAGFILQENKKVTDNESIIALNAII